jgi:Xaa-Pro aminopeptidase
MSAQTPEQSYFEWTSLPFSKEELQQRRNNLIEVLKQDEKKGLVIIPARDGRSHGETFRQLDDFYYFTGLELPNSILVIDHEEGSAVVYAPERDARFESSSRPNDFPGRPLSSDETIAVKSGIEIININELRNRFKIEARKRQTILLNTGRNDEINLIPNQYVSNPSIAEILVLALEWNHAGFNYENIYSLLKA